MRACASLNHGSPNPTKFRRMGFGAGSLRNVVSDDTDGSTVTEWLRASHGTTR